MDSDIVEKVRELAFRLSVRGTQPGHVGENTRQLAEKVRQQLMTMLDSEVDRHTTTEFKRYKKGENGEFVTDENGSRILEPDPDRAPVTWIIPNGRGEILEAMIRLIAAAVWGKGSFSPEQHEAAILKAAKALPERCDQLQKSPDSSVLSPNKTENEGTKTAPRQSRMSKDVANENLKALLEIDPKKYLDMGQVELARAVGCSRGTLGKTSAYRFEMPKLRRKLS